MNTIIKTKPPTWFWVAASAALIWNLIGVAAYLGQMMMDMSTLPDAQRTFYETTPAWATSAFAIAVFAGTAGSVALLLRQRWAILALVASLFGIIVQMAHSLLLENGLEVFGTSALILPLLTLAIGLTLIWFAIVSKNQSWL